MIFENEEKDDKHIIIGLKKKLLDIELEFHNLGFKFKYNLNLFTT